MYTENKSMMVLTFKKELINSNLDKKYIAYYIVISLLWMVGHYLFCGGYFIKEILMEVHPPFQMGGPTSFTDLR